MVSTTDNTVIVYFEEATLLHNRGSSVRRPRYFTIEVVI